MIRLKPLPPLALTDLQPSFYDVESVSTIEMVSKLYAYLQNMVNDYNDFVTEVNNNIDDFESDIIDKFECFRNCMINTMNDYIESIDIKIDLQDNIIAEAIQNQNAEIQEAVDYMKNNIVATATSVVNQAIENGDITVSIDYDEPTEALNIVVNREDDNNGI